MEEGLLQLSFHVACGRDESGGAVVVVCWKNSKKNVVWLDFCVIIWAEVGHFECVPASQNLHRWGLFLELHACPSHNFSIVTQLTVDRSRCSPTKLELAGSRPKFAGRCAGVRMGNKASHKRKSERMVSFLFDFIRVAVVITTKAERKRRVLLRSSQNKVKG